MEDRARFYIFYAARHGPVTVRWAIEQRMPADQLEILRTAEASERALIAGLVCKITGESAP
jgi:hypothetical protein